ncbi:MAG: hypothetical protein LQ345_003765 [Seirophora villosa]|nr:MAG: hypothetical protein LQ345_003765 [Seirophora villosa]
MPAPLARGIIVSISLLLAAGIAVYENPQVRQWVDESRRKIAFALHNLGDDFDPPSSQRRDTFRDASTSEDASPEAVERRRKARQEILERGRMMEERRRSQEARSNRTKSFDDLVDEGGNLKPDSTQAKSTAAETQPEQPGLRNRNAEAQGAALGTMLASPFSDEAHLEDFSASASSPHTYTRHSRSSSTATLPASPAPPPVPPKEPLNPSPFEDPSQSPQPRLLIDTDDMSNHPSEALVDLTPTTSAASVATDLSELDQHSYPSNHSQTDFWSVHEWAENNGAPAQFYTPSRSEVAGDEPHQDREEGSSSVGDDRSEADSGERVSMAGSISDMDFMSEAGGISTPGSWTEVGSQVSEGF